MVHQAPDKRHVGTRANPYELVRVRGGPRKAWIDNDHLGAVFLGAKYMLHCHRVRFGCITADKDHRLGVMHVVERVGHRSIAPGIGYASNRGGVTDTRLVIDVIGSPECDELALQV